MQSIKEKKLLVKFAQSMGQPIDPAIVEEVKKYEEMQTSVKESVRSNILEDLRELFDTAVENKVTTLEPAKEEVKVEEVVEIVEKVVEPVKEEVKQPSLIERSAVAIEKAEKANAIKEDSYQQPSVPAPTDLKAVKEKIKFLEQWLAKISLTGPGGGAGSIETLDRATKVVSTNYTFQKSDYYVGVNASNPVTITLPSTAKAGSMIVVKDESGNCSNNNITLSGNIDNDPGGAILAIDNGALQFIYRSGWRII
jgi:hypothetical protein